MARWYETLSKSLISSNNSSDSSINVNDIEYETLNKLEELYYNDELNNNKSKLTNNDIIPKFFYSIKPISNSNKGENNETNISKVKYKIYKEARARFLEEKLSNIPSGDEMGYFYHLIRGNKERIDFKEFLNVRDKVTPKIHQYFTSNLFLKFPQNSKGEINSDAYFRYIVTKIRSIQTRVPLICYNTHDDGYLSEHELETYVFEQIPHMRQLSGMAVEFYPYYVFTAVRKFLFFRSIKKEKT